MKNQEIKTLNLDEQFNVLSESKLLLVKAGILLFGIVLNICIIDLFY